MGTSFALPILAIVVIGLILGSLINFASAFLAIPIVLIIMVSVFLASETMQKQRRTAKLRQFRRSARARKTDFTEEDKRTVAT
jgi:ABC-type transport system involved in cytochrome bd biosynthesis fused ATPase/permease subunit